MCARLFVTSALSSAHPLTNLAPAQVEKHKTCVVNKYMQWLLDSECVSLPSPSNTPHHPHSPSQASLALIPAARCAPARWHSATPSHARCNALDSITCTPRSCERGLLRLRCRTLASSSLCHRSAFVANARPFIHPHNTHHTLSLSVVLTYSHALPERSISRHAAYMIAWCKVHSLILSASLPRHAPITLGAAAQVRPTVSIVHGSAQRRRADHTVGVSARLPPAVPPRLRRVAPGNHGPCGVRLQRTALLVYCCAPHCHRVGAVSGVTADRRLKCC